ncbi:uncharacterized protein BT62DRAFT_971064 [Guyanagaster necrorhizus]|uniref:Transcription factor TFIIIC triple barrel domain-containing protein n=1 Tax=Guyanagaster necrorhizus TaxID=856835 RepID=A0A9P7VNF0_9AGAR|nr:uncharacterized protein BT62DRAFT_971064 [Guyanagaster necrorhizus MCA 3950]KAG7444403.1 hypothetical protein BT62DRAFT_971064 [Guyanagaster necrorhizus MCA 3950]
MSLCPGYKHVDAFGPDDEYDDEEEVSYVTLDLGSVEPSLLPSSANYRLIGLDTPTPFLQLSGTVLKGRHECLLGTELLFVDGKDASVDRSKRTVAYLESTKQRVCFKEVRLHPKGEEKEKDKEAEADEDSGRHSLDRMTGKQAPPPRKKRAKKKAEDIAEGEGAPEQTGKSERKGKGKKKQVDNAYDDNDEEMM